MAWYGVLATDDCDDNDPAVPLQGLVEVTSPSILSDDFG